MASRSPSVASTHVQVILRPVGALENFQRMVHLVFLLIADAVARIALKKVLPLLMLWTAPPPARECHESGCC
jgi:hypothetical protein